MFKLQHSPAQGLPDPAGQLVVLPRPGRIGFGYLDADRRGGAGHPWIASRGWRGIDERHDLDSAGHQRSLWPVHRQCSVSPAGQVGSPSFRAKARRGRPGARP